MASTVTGARAIRARWAPVHSHMQAAAHANADTLFLSIRLPAGVCRGSEVLREVAWVIFDEVHYMQVST